MEGLSKLYHAFPNADWYYKVKWNYLFVLSIYFSWISNLFYKIYVSHLQVDDDTMLVPSNVDKLLATQDKNDKLLLGYMIEAEIDKDTKKFAGRMYLVLCFSVSFC